MRGRRPRCWQTPGLPASRSPLTAAAATCATSVAMMTSHQCIAGISSSALRRIALGTMKAGGSREVESNPAVNGSDAM